ncbi:hypothetical protein F4775DRAFT_602361 [Biscogniauxia sp. FL1348]|nr:hypothetical protein F4775DRAFT_602361 [Biscogniauxia sp. FL1348]
MGYSDPSKCDNTSFPVPMARYPISLVSTTQFSYLPRALVEALVEKFPDAYYNRTSGLWQMPCYHRYHSATIDFGFEDTLIHIPLRAFVLEFMEVCYLGAIEVGENAPAVLGGNFLGSTYLVFDQDQKSLYMAQFQDCGSNITLHVDNEFSPEFHVDTQTDIDAIHAHSEHNPPLNKDYPVDDKINNYEPATHLEILISLLAEHLRKPQRQQHRHLAPLLRHVIANPAHHNSNIVLVACAHNIHMGALPAEQQHLRSERCPTNNLLIPLLFRHPSTHHDNDNANSNTDGDAALAQLDHHHHHVRRGGGAHDHGHRGERDHDGLRAAADGLGLGLGHGHAADLRERLSLNDDDDARRRCCVANTIAPSRGGCLSFGFLC